VIKDVKRRGKRVGGACIAFCAVGGEKNPLISLIRMEFCQGLLIDGTIIAVFEGSVVSFLFAGCLVRIEGKHL